MNLSNVLWLHVLVTAVLLLPSNAQTAPAITFVDGGAYAIKVMNADGSNRSTILMVGSPTSPSMSPDGSQVTFAATLNGQKGVWVIGSNGAGLRLVTPLVTVVPHLVRPTWSPVPTLDGQYKLLFWDQAAAQSSSPHDLFVVNIDGSGRTQLTFDTAPEDYPEWSFDATRIVYTRGSLFVAQLGLLSGQLVITGTQDVTSVAGSPLQAATGLAFCGCANTGDTVLISAITPDSGGHFDLWSIPLASPSQAQRLCNTTGASERWASFSADDSRIFFHGSKGIMAMNPNGSGVATISRSGSRPNHRRQ